jgi:hypothetical protein
MASTEEPLNILPASEARVPLHTREADNAEIRRRATAKVKSFANAPPEAIGKRIRELEQEWDVERMLELNASVISLAGFWLAWHFGTWMVLALPALVSLFLLQHSIQGWCPPLPLFRYMV